MEYTGIEHNGADVHKEYTGLTSGIIHLELMFIGNDRIGMRYCTLGNDVHGKVKLFVNIICFLH